MQCTMWGLLCTVYISSFAGKGKASFQDQLNNFAVGIVLFLMQRPGILVLKTESYVGRTPLLCPMLAAISWKVELHPG